MSQFSQTPTPSVYAQSQGGSRTPKRPACARCGSRRWRRENNRGVLICSEGHVLEGHLRESTLQTEISQHATRVRRVKVGKTRKRYSLKQVYRGERGRLLLLQIFTILLRKQVEALISVLRAPAVLEEVAQSLWRAYLSTLSLDANLILDSRASLDASSSRQGAGSQSGYSSDESRWSNTRHGSQSRLRSPFDDDPGLPLTPEALKAMTENESSSSDESERSNPDQPSQSDDDSQRTPQAGKRTKKRRSDDLLYPRIECTIGILYLACIRLRLPIIMQDLVNLVVTKQLPYIGFLAAIPEHVKAKMSGSMISHLSILNPPRLYTSLGDGLINICHKLMSRLGQVNPNLLPIPESVPNVSLVMLRFSQILLVPSPIHALALHMISRLKPQYLVLSKLPNAPSDSTGFRRRMRPDDGPRFPPDWFIMASLVATIQIVLQGLQKPYPSDNFSKILQQSLPHPKQWMEGIISLRDSVELEDPHRLCEIDLVSASEEELDAYIDLAGKFLLSETSESKHGVLEDTYFPLTPSTPKPRVVKGLGYNYDRILANLMLTKVKAEDLVTEAFKEDATALVLGVIDRASSVVGACEEDFRRVLELTSKSFGELLGRTTRMDSQSED